MKRIFTLFFSLICFSPYLQTVTTFTTSGSFTVPAGVSSIFVEAWGAGGAGGSAVGSSSPQYRAMGGAGGGGAYTFGTITVSPGDIINFTVAPSTGLNGTSTYLNGGTSSFGSIIANGGLGGESVNAGSAGGHIGGQGGTGGIGNINGGNGGSSVGYAGSTTGTTAGAGGGAGTISNGGDGGPWSTIGGQINGGSGGIADGGAGANGKGSSGGNGNAGTAPGGGGSGAYAAASTSFRSGGAGARGQIRITYTIAAPISLIDFKLHTKNEQTIILFSSASEINNSHYIIEWSKDASEWTQIGTVKGSGTCHEVKEYSYIHEHPKSGINYYRLTQVDFDGRKETFPPKSIYFESNQRNFDIIPNLAFNNVKVEFEKPVENGRLHIYNIDGQLMQTYILASGIDVLRIDVSELPTGQYIAKYIDGEDIINKKFIKQ